MFLGLISAFLILKIKSINYTIENLTEFNIVPYAELS